MPTETRRIIFKEVELLQAILDYNKIAREKLPVGNIMSCKILCDDSIEVRLEIYEIRSDKRCEVTLDAATIGAALLRFCIDNKIPLPRKARKRLQVLGDSIALDLSMELFVNEIPI
jgi:hypothetical protein